jgi:thiopeptide-type bacteriocin biosynthesis protein
MSWGVLRAPLLPLASYHGAAVAEPGDEHLMPADPLVRAAIMVGSDHLAAALQRTPRSAPAASRLHAKLLRYVIRMSTRPTPYGLFAGVGLVRWGPTSDVALAPEPLRTRARPDMEWLFALVMELEHNPRLRKELLLFANPFAIERAGWVMLAEPGDGAKADDRETRTRRVRATLAVRRVLAAARSPVPYAEVVRALRGDGSATPAQIDAHIERLCREGFLLTDLRPPLTGLDPARYVCDRLIATAEGRRVGEELSAFLCLLQQWDALPLEERAHGWAALTTHGPHVRPDVAADVPTQVDMALPLTGGVHHDVAREAARAAELLLRMSPYPIGPPTLRAYREHFEERYGPDREVPLLELLDPDFGLGLPVGSPPPPRARAHDGSRDQMLLGLAVDAVRGGHLVVDLNEDLLSRLETWTPALSRAPQSLEICISVLASSRAAIDAGNFLVVVGPNLGSDSAGRSLGRFAHVLGTPAHEALRSIITENAPAATPLQAELVYLPRQLRAANVAVRPALTHHEIVAGTSAGVPPDQVIPLDELVIGVRDRRFYVRWPALDADIAVSEMHMVNASQAPAAMRFLQDVERDGRVVFSRFDWGPAADLPFLPRVQSGRIVLATARWRLETLAEVHRSCQDLRTWRTRWSVPRHVYLAEGDQRLLLDLEQPSHRDLLSDELKQTSPRGQPVIEEALPGPGDAWLPGPDGARIAELVVPLRSVTPPIPHSETTRRRVVSPVAPSVRLRPPGSDWLFLKLYCPLAFEDELIAENVLDFVTFAEAAGIARRWFFVRYADPQSHLRLRFQGEPGHLFTLMPHACRWAADLVSDGLCLRLAFDTYDREIERYGGEAGMEIAEEIFAVDSRTVAELLDVIRRRPALDRITIAVLTVDRLLEGLAITAADRLRWYRSWAPPSRIGGAEYRHRDPALRRVLTHGRGTEAGWESAAPILEHYRRALEPLSSPLKARIAADGQRAKERSVYRSYVHMHLNRLLGRDATTTEHLVLELAGRVRESLSRAPCRSTGT